MQNEHITLFITDDDVDDRQFLSDALIKQGFHGTVEQFDNGAELISRLSNRTKPSGLVVLDLNMPVKNGFDTLKELKQDSILRYMPVIILSASSNAEDEMYCTKLGCSEFLKKPLSFTGYQNIAEKIITVTFQHH